jgi:uncharacterized RDD family membrane protein YckC
MDQRADIDGGRLRVESVTGVPLELSVAGPGGRSFAFIIDFHIRILAAVAWFFGFTMILSLVADGRSSAPGWLALVTIAPPWLIYFLYHPVLEIAMAGRTPGKRMAGLRIVTLDGMVPGIGALLIRNLFRFVDGLPAMYVVGLVTSMSTRRHQRVGDLAAGTILVYDDPARTESVADLSRAGTASGLSTAQTELIQDLVERWEALDPTDRLELARRLLTKLDPAAAASHDVLLNDSNALAALQNRLGGLR